MPGEGLGIVPRRTRDGMRSGLSESRVLPIVLRPMFPLALVRVAALHVPPGSRDEFVEFIHGHGIRRHGKRTADGSLSAHYEHTIVITNAEPILLTAA